MKKWPLVLVMILTLCGACSIPFGIGGGGKNVVWTGTITMHSSSVPNPYNWQKTATLAAGKATMSASWWPEKSKSSAEARKEWERTSTAADQEAIAEAVAALNTGNASVPNPGACWTTVVLQSSAGRSMKLTTSPQDGNYDRATALYRLIAGPDDPTLPAHSFVCG